MPNAEDHTHIHTHSLPMRKENKGKIKNSETGAVLIKKIAIHIFLLQLKICTKIRGIFMLNPPSPPYVKEEQEEN